MSQESTGSDGSDISHVMSEGTYQELQSLVGHMPENYLLESTLIKQEYTQDYVASSPGTSQTMMNTSSCMMPSISGYTTSSCYYNQSPCRQPQAIAPLPYGNASHAQYPLNIPPEWLSGKHDIPGSFKFNIRFEDEKTPIVKGVPWTFSSQLNKIFAKKGIDIPIGFSFKAPPQQDFYAGLYLKVVLLYSQSEYHRTVVQRCPNHQSSDGIKHVIESSQSESFYGITGEGHHVVSVPMRCPHVGEDYILEHFRFLCLNTCSGGPDRKPYHCIFLLEYQGTIVGKRVLNIKICTTPGRDRPKEEAPQELRRRRVPKAKRQEPVPVPMAHPLQLKTLASSTTTTCTSSTTTIKEEDDDDDNELYIIQVRGRKKYESLMLHKEALDIRDLVPKEILENYRASCPPCGPDWFLNRNKTSQTSSTTTTPTNLPSTSGLNSGQTSGPSLTSRFCLSRHKKPVQKTDKASVVCTVVVD